MKNKILKTLFTIILWIILIYICKYFQYETNIHLKNNFRNPEEVPGIGGIFGIVISALFIFYLIPSIWRKSQNERIIELGKEEELNELNEAFKLNLLSKDEYEGKKSQLLKDSIKSEKKEKEQNEQRDYFENEKERIESSLIF